MYLYLLFRILNQLQDFFFQKWVLYTIISDYTILGWCFVVGEYLTSWIIELENNDISYPFSWCFPCCCWCWLCSQWHASWSDRKNSSASKYCNKICPAEFCRDQHCMYLLDNNFSDLFLTQWSDTASHYDCECVLTSLEFFGLNKMLSNF